MEMMRARGVDDFKLSVSTENGGAIGFYTRLGWAPRQLLMYHSDSKPPPAVSARAAPESGSGQISWEMTLRVRRGQLEAFRALNDEMARVAAEEAGAASA